MALIGPDWSDLSDRQQTALIVLSVLLAFGYMGYLMYFPPS